MKKILFTVIIMSLAALSFAQIGIGTTTPNSTLDVRGSVSMNYRAFTTSSVADITDNMMVFTGTSPATLTLPDATTCIGRAYWIKNTSSNISVLTIATTSSQTIDGITPWLLDEFNESLRVVSDGADWNISGQSLPTGSGTDWSQGGNSVAAIKKLGTINNFDLPFITNNTEKMRLSAAGNFGIGTTTFNGTYPEKLYVNAGATTSVNAIVGRGTINNYLQLNIQNLSSGTNASSDVVATANNGSETTNYVDMGINSSTNTSGIMGAANDAYLYNIGQNFLLGTGTAAKSMVFMTGGTTQATNERMRINGTGSVGIGATVFNATYPERLLVDAGATGNTNFQNVIVGKGNTNSYAQLNIQNISAGNGASSDVVATADNGSETTNFVDMGINSSTNSSGIMGAADDAYLYNMGQNFLLGTGTAAKSLVFMTGGTSQATNERMRITGTGNVGIATNSPAANLDVSGTYKLGTSGTVLTNMIKTTVAVNDAASFGYTSTEQVTVTVTGATVNASVIMNPRSALPTGIGIGWVRVSAANTVIIGFTNTDTTPRAVGSVTFDVTIIQ